jgi:hypothetical protein
VPTWIFASFRAGAHARHSDRDPTQAPLAAIAVLGFQMRLPCAAFPVLGPLTCRRRRQPGQPRSMLHSRAQMGDQGAANQRRVNSSRMDRRQPVDPSLPFAMVAAVCAELFGDNHRPVERCHGAERLSNSVAESGWGRMRYPEVGAWLSQRGLVLVNASQHWFPPYDGQTFR